jgi:hydroxymethylpyrimidine/phosphomethylpyrimidine kinase
MTRVALTIAGSDPSGGAGIQADLKTFHQRGVYGTSVVTVVTAQNTRRVLAVAPVDARLVAAQLDAVLEDIPPHAAKTGALGDAAIVRAVAERAERLDFPLVIDPVLASKQGHPLLDDDGRAALVERLLPRALLVTPNLDEAAVLAGIPVGTLAEMEEAARRIAALGVEAVLVKGGHLPSTAVDVLLWKGELRYFPAHRIDTPGAHGTGCTFSAAITAELACGAPLSDAIESAKRFITAALASRPGIGKGLGPVDHHARFGR